MGAREIIESELRKGIGEVFPNRAELEGAISRGEDKDGLFGKVLDLQDAFFERMRVILENRKVLLEFIERVRQCEMGGAGSVSGFGSLDERLICNSRDWIVWSDLGSFSVRYSFGLADRIKWWEERLDRVSVERIDLEGIATQIFGFPNFESLMDSFLLASRTSYFDTLYGQELEDYWSKDSIFGDRFFKFQMGGLRNRHNITSGKSGWMNWAGYLHLKDLVKGDIFVDLGAGFQTFIGVEEEPYKFLESCIEKVGEVFGESLWESLFRIPDEGRSSKVFREAVVGCLEGLEKELGEKVDATLGEVEEDWIRSLSKAFGGMERWRAFLEGYLSSGSNVADRMNVNRVGGDIVYAAQRERESLRSVLNGEAKGFGTGDEIKPLYFFRDWIVSLGRKGAVFQELVKDFKSGIEGGKWSRNIWDLTGEELNKRKSEMIESFRKYISKYIVKDRILQNFKTGMNRLYTAGRDQEIRSFLWEKIGKYVDISEDVEDVSSIEYLENTSENNFKETVKYINSSPDVRKNCGDQSILDRIDFMGGENYKDFCKELKEFGEGYGLKVALRRANENEHSGGKVARYLKTLNSLIYDYFLEETAVNLGKGVEKGIVSGFEGLEGNIPFSVWSVAANASEECLKQKYFKGNLIYDGVRIPATLSKCISDFLMHFNNSDKNICFNFWVTCLVSEEILEDKKSVREDWENFLSIYPWMMDSIASSEIMVRYLNEMFSVKSSHLSKGAQIIKAFTDRYKSSKRDIIKSLIPVVEFYHNNEATIGFFEMLINSKYFLNLRLNYFRNFMEIYLSCGEICIQKSKYGFISGYGGGESLISKIYSIKKEMSIGRGIDQKTLDGLFSEDIIEVLKIFGTFSRDAASFDRAVEAYGRIDPSTVNKLHGFVFFIKSFKEMKDYISSAKKKDERLLDNNYEWQIKNGGKFRFRVLGDLDPRYFSVGAEVNCCQRIGGEAESAVIDSFINPVAGVIILEADVEGNGSWTLISQSYCHIVPEEGLFILDNIEAGKWRSDSLLKLIGYSFEQVYAMLAKKIMQKGFKKVLCGKSWTVCLTGNNFESYSMKQDPRSFAIKKDSENQLEEGDRRDEEDEEEGSEMEVYSDFDYSDSIDLSSPKFEVPNIEAIKLAKVNDLFLKIGSGMLLSEIKNDHIRALAKMFQKLALYDYANKLYLC